MFNEEKIVLPSIAHFQSIARGGKNRVFPVGFPGGGFFMPTLFGSYQFTYLVKKKCQFLIRFE